MSAEKEFTDRTAGALADRMRTPQTEWDTEELRRDFEVLGFQAPFVVVRRKSDGQKGSLQFDHAPRRYYAWSPHTD